MFVDEWMQFTSAHYILQAVTGYKLEFTSNEPPTQTRIPYPYKLNKEEKEAVDTEIHHLLQLNVIEMAQDVSGYFSNIFTQPKKDGATG